MTTPDSAISVVPANEAPWEDLQLVIGTSGPAARCQCQRYKLRGVSGAIARAAVDFARQRGARAIEGYPITPTSVILEELHVGTRGVFDDAGFDEVSRPSLRRVVMRLNF